MSSIWLGNCFVSYLFTFVGEPRIYAFRILRFIPQGAFHVILKLASHRKDTRALQIELDQMNR